MRVAAGGWEGGAEGVSALTHFLRKHTSRDGSFLLPSHIHICCIAASSFSFFSRKPCRHSDGNRFFSGGFHRAQSSRYVHMFKGSECLTHLLILRYLATVSLLEVPDHLQMFFPLVLKRIQFTKSSIARFHERAHQEVFPL